MTIQCSDNSLPVGPGPHPGTISTVVLFTRHVTSSVGKLLTKFSSDRFECVDQSTLGGFDDLSSPSVVVLNTQPRSTCQKVGAG
jgi:hypothetical protein